MDAIQYVNLIEICPLGIEIWGVKNGELAVPVNNTLMRHMAFLVADTQLCVLILQLAPPFTNPLICCDSYRLQLFSDNLYNGHLLKSQIKSPVHIKTPE